MSRVNQSPVSLMQNSMEFIRLDEVSLVAALLGGFIVLFGFVSYFVKEKLYLSESLICMICGIAFGPFVSNIITPDKWGDIDEITKQFARIVIAIQVMAAGIQLPKAYLWKESKSLFFLLVPVMSWMWVTSALAIWWMIPKLSFLEALCIASCVAPTDPVLANSIMKGKFAEKYVPTHLRDILSAESGANDCLGFPFLYLAMYLIKTSTGPALGEWAYYIMGYQVILSAIFGAIIGYIARKSLRWAAEKNMIDKEMFLAFSIVLALFIMGVVSILGSDELLACFIAGNSFTWDDWFRQETVEAHFQPILDMLLNLAVFAYIGAIIPFSSFTNDSLGLSYWRLAVMAILIILFRRLPIIMALMRKIPALKTYREGLFAGWFGPIGVGAIFYGELTKEALEKYDAHSVAQEIVKPVVFFLVLSSIVVHGISIPLMKIGKRVNTMSRTTSLNFPTQPTSLNTIKLDGIIFRKTNTSSAEKVDELKDIAESNNSSSSTPTVRVPPTEQIFVNTDNLPQYQNTNANGTNDNVIIKVSQESAKFSHEHDDIIEERNIEDEKTRVITNPP
ncbi:4665_t:CDS:10 [Acaulospora morrowiae]|uniref:4665_t:CDS:1 n=1 Tax=Acaulospora morrowiae TaxID=94023 RepID=A0A9N9HPT5_9GLOM|nr:4665_t:CDS:10 [Acaulospora morrowiae]